MSVASIKLDRDGDGKFGQTLMLNADALGQKGQSRFQEICADAGLICNSSNYDRTGWDFIVEFPFETKRPAIAPLESRATPLACHVQVKAILEKNDRLRLRLTSAERLAKEQKPTFVYIFKVKGDLSFSDSYLIHLIDAPLGKILKRLRQEDAKGTTTPNRKTITISAAVDGLRLPPSGESLREAMVAAIGDDLQRYANEKARQLKQLGLPERPYQLSATIKARNMAQLVDGFLGIGDGLQATEIAGRHTRFGITLADPEGPKGSGVLSIQPEPIDTCTVLVRKDKRSAPVAFKGKIYVPAIPGLPPRHRKLLVRTDFFTLAIARRNITIKTSNDIAPQSPLAWGDYWRFGRLFAENDGCELELNFDKKPINIIAPIKGRIKGRSGSLSAEECRGWIDTCWGADRLLRHVGILDQPKVTMEDLKQARFMINWVEKLIDPSFDMATIAVKADAPKDVEVAPETEIAILGHVKLGEVAIGCHIWMKAHSERHEANILWRPDQFELKALKRLQLFPTQYEELWKQASAEVPEGNCLMLAANDVHQALPSPTGQS